LSKLLEQCDFRHFQARWRGWKMSMDNTNFGQMWSAGCGRFSFCEVVQRADYAVCTENLTHCGNVILEKFCKIFQSTNSSVVSWPIAVVGSGSGANDLDWLRYGTVYLGSGAVEDGGGQFRVFRGWQRGHGV